MAQVIDTKGKVLRTEAAPAFLAGANEGKGHVLYRAVHREFANTRSGTASTKKRDEVSGGGRKPWKQKGTGRARQGSNRSPQWRHGGVVFGPQPRSYVEDLNKKERRVAFLAALAQRFSEDAIVLLDVGDFSLTKTAQAATLLFGSAKAAKSSPRTLLVHSMSEPHGAALALVSRNLPRLGITHDGALDVKDLLRYERIILTTAAYEALVARLAPKEKA
ncbi:MAG TPA: 50S ribosomal protein L4 [Candidatus Dormibacteraeota bacterium]|nr:50S ribosomal protein L4 [Candidatus Dormibacteraeota bacterium]